MNRSHHASLAATALALLSASCAGEGSSLAREPLETEEALQVSSSSLRECDLHDAGNGVILPGLCRDRRRGDVNGDGRADIFLAGVGSLSATPVAHSSGDGNFQVVANPNYIFNALASLYATVMTSGDFDGDGKEDFLLLEKGGSASVPIAYSNGDGTFRLTAAALANFSTWLAHAGAQLVAGDFNGDSRTDIALAGGAGWNTVPVALSQGDGTFSQTNHFIGTFATWAASPRVKVLSGDFDNDGRYDLALVGGSGWSTIPVARSNGDGTFTVSNNSVANFPQWAQEANAKFVAADFSGDGRADIALLGTNRSSIPVAFATYNGGFIVTNHLSTLFAAWAREPSVKVVAGDFDNDGADDIALTGVFGWNTIPVAFSGRNGSFTVTNNVVSSFPAWSTEPSAKARSGF